VTKSNAVPEERLAYYHEVRPQIRDGDLFLFRGRFLVSKLFEKLTHSYYSHAAIVAWWDGRLMILQAEGVGIQAIPLSVAVAEYPGRADWYRLRRDSFPDPDRSLKTVLAEAKADLGLSYGYADLARALWGYLKKLKLRDPVSPKGLYCSEYVEKCFDSGGMSLTGRPDITTFPQHIAESPRVEYVCSIRHDPSKPDPRRDDDVPG